MEVVHGEVAKFYSVFAHLIRAACKVEWVWYLQIPIPTETQSIIYSIFGWKNERFSGSLGAFQSGKPAGWIAAWRLVIRKTSWCKYPRLTNLHLACKQVPRQQSLEVAAMFWSLTSWHFFTWIPKMPKMVAQFRQQINALIDFGWQWFQHYRMHIMFLNKIWEDEARHMITDIIES